MKKMILCLLVLSVLLVSCGKEEQKDYGDSYIPEKDVQNFSGTLDAVWMGGGFYAADEEGKVDFIDGGSGETAPLCGKPNCSHDGGDCNAFFDSLAYIGACDGYLYIVASEDGALMNRVLYRVSPDGSERKKIRNLYSFEDEEDASLSLDFAVHRGSAYMVTNWDENSRKEREQVWYRVPLQEDGENTELYRIRGYCPVISMVDFDASYIYVCASWWEDEDLKRKTERNLKFDIRTGEITEIDIPEGTFMTAAVQGTVYYTARGEEKTDLFRMRGDGTGAEKFYEWEHPELPPDGIITLHKDKRFLYLEHEKGDMTSEPPKECVVIDYDGNEVLKLGEDELKGKSPCWSNREQLLLRDYENGTYEIVKLP